MKIIPPLFLFKKYRWHTILYEFQVYDIVIQHLYALQYDPHKSSSPLYTIKCYDIIVYIPCSIHYIPMAYLFYKRNFVPLIPFHLCQPSPHHPLLQQQ